jgi:nucleotide-diphospho-sugar transferase
VEFLLAANHRLKTVAQRCVRSLDDLDYRRTVFDLGGLGFGESFPVEDPTFQAEGYYPTHFTKWHSRAMHKPRLILNFLPKVKDFLVYLDADTFVRRPIGEIEGDYDVGVTVRRLYEQRQAVLGRVNAGVVFLNRTAAAFKFVERWVAETEKAGNDQVALNKLVDRGGLRIRLFPTDIYNWYYFPDVPTPDAKILHFKTANAQHLGGRFRLQQELRTA